MLKLKNLHVYIGKTHVLDDVSLEKLVQFLSKLRSKTSLLQIKTLDISKNRAKPNLLNSTIGISQLLKTTKG